MMAERKTTKSIRPCTKAIAPKAAKEVKKTPPTKPSSPSVSLAEKAVATITKMKMGTYQIPTEKSTKKGMLIMLQSNLKKNHQAPTTATIKYKKILRPSLKPPRLKIP